MDVKKKKIHYIPVLPPTCNYYLHSSNFPSFLLNVYFFKEW